MTYVTPRDMGYKEDAGVNLERLAKADGARQEVTAFGFTLLSFVFRIYVCISTYLSW